MLPDLLSATLRGLAFVAVLQAGGVALFLALFDPSLDRSGPRIRRLGMAAVLASGLVLPAQYALEAARMTGELASVFDGELQQFVLQTPAARILALRLLGIVLVGCVLVSSKRQFVPVGIAGAVLIAVSFMLTGHTASSPDRWVLGPVLVLHLLVVEFWFGALLPLIAIGRHEMADIAAKLVARFSRLATILVPLILAAGVLMAIRLLPNASAIATGYGLALLAKTAAFALLLLLAAINKWRLGPELAAGNPAEKQHFMTSVMLEFWIIAAVLMGTAALTTFWSPEG